LGLTQKVVAPCVIFKYLSTMSLISSRLFFSPIASMVPSYATAGALLYVAILMLVGMERLDWSDNTKLLPALIMIPLTLSIANGIAIGFISYVILKVFSGRSSDINLPALFLFIIFLLKFIFL